MTAAIVGGQYGSEGKGLIAGVVARDYDHHVRVGAANAGHTLYTFDESEGADLFEKHVMQQIPCAAYANPYAQLYIGPGAQISVDIFRRELELLADWRKRNGLPPTRVLVDYRAHVITSDQIEREQDSGLAERIGSTSTLAREGIGTAQADRVMRASGCMLADDVFGPNGWATHRMVVLTDVSKELLDPRMEGDILLEGTQGTGLSLTTGQFPYCTSRNTTAAGLAADCGVAPNSLERVILVCRSYPIRVAGPSGPFYHGSREMSWDDLGVDPENERTTVTKKIRRVATFSMEQVVDAARINGATEIALTFADYLDKAIAGGAGRWDHSDLASFPRVLERVHTIEQATGLPVTYIGTGPHSVIRKQALAVAA